MQDAVWLLRATPQGVPAANGVDGHFVLWSSVPPVAVSQLHISGTFYPDWDCAEGCLISALKMRGLRVPSGHVLELEALTNSRYGTGWDGLIHAASVNGLDPSAVIHGDPQQGWIMNPAWGGVIPPQGFWPYLAASQHMYIELRAPALQPSIAFTEDDDMGNFAPAWNAKRPGQDDGDIFVYDAAPGGHVWHGYEIGAQHTATEDLGVPMAGATIVGVTGLYTGNPPTYIACRALVKDGNGGMRVFEKAGNYRAWKGWGNWVQSL